MGGKRPAESTNSDGSAERGVSSEQDSIDSESAPHSTPKDVKKTKFIRSIILGTAAPRKPRVGPGYQVTNLPEAREKST
jgi:hypothetical protein